MNYQNNKKFHKTRYPQIPSPYNFVPLSDFVYFPDWAESVSQDVPFSNGVSGELEIEVIAKTPVYVRNGGKNSKEDPSFFQLSPNGNYMIPSSSFKGMLRNIIEIASFGKMQRIDNNRYSIRDLTFKPYQNTMTKISQKAIVSKVKSGWLSEKEGKWFLTPCYYARVTQSDLEEYYENGIEIGRAKESAIEKYKKCEGKELTIKCTIDQTEKDYSHGKGLFRYRKATNLGKGSQLGTIVFTGQPNPRIDRNGKPIPKTKRIDFIFFGDFSYSINLEDDKNKLRKDFEFIHSDDKENPLEEWAFWKAKMQDEQQVPVFYLEDHNGKITSMGLAMMYRLAYNLTIEDAINNTSPEHILAKPDLAELIFGYVSKNNEALRGRVQVGHLVAQNKLTSSDLVTTVLGNPKPTYYPNYICQDIDQSGSLKQGNEYKTLLDDDAQIRGWKRYPVRNDFFLPSPPPPPEVKGKINMDVATRFKPLPAESIFKGNIRFHNLLPEELGAILWALTLGGNTNLRHSIGMAKPYGFGSIQITVISKEENILEKARHSFINLMKEEMQNKCQADWQNSAQIKLLLAMADPTAEPPMRREYPRLEMDRINDFSEYKKAKKALLAYRPEIPNTSTLPIQLKPTKPRQYKNGDNVQCEVLEEKTKKGGWKFRICGENKDCEGILHPSQVEKTPKDIAPGKTYNMTIFSYIPKNCQFKWC